MIRKIMIFAVLNISFSCLGSLADTETSLKNEFLLGGFENEEEIQKMWQDRPIKWLVLENMKPELSVFHATERRYSLKVTFPGSETDSWPGISRCLAEKDRNWSKFVALKLDVYNPEDEEIILSTRIDAPSLEDPKKMATFWGGQRLAPKEMTHVVMLISDIGQKIDISKIDYLMFFLSKPKSEHTLFIDNIRLEGKTNEASEKKDVELFDVFTQTVREKGKVPITRLSSAPRIDGVIDDPCWTNATKVTCFLDTYGGKNPVSEQTIAYLGYDEENLYFSFVCKESQMDKLAAKITQRDGPVWNDDCIEIFLTPGLITGRYYHFTVNSLGAQCDERWDQGIMFREWGTAWQARASKGKDAWSVEVAIPFYILDFIPDADYNWKINLCRGETPKGQFSALFPTLGGFHAPDKFGKLDEFNVDCKKYYYRITDLSLGKKKFGENKLAFNIENETGSDKEILLQLSLADPSGATASSRKQLSLKKGTNPVSLSYQLKAKGAYALSFLLSDAEGKNTFYASPSYAIVPPPPILFTLSVPSYGNTIFATQEIPDVKGRVNLNIEQSLKTGTIWALLLDKENNSLAENVMPLKAGVDEVEISFPVESLPIGEYSIKICLLDEHNRQITSVTSPLRKAGAHLDEVRVDEDNNLIVNGKPFFPIGIWSNGEEECLAEISKAGFNTGYSMMGWFPAESYRKGFELARKYGLWIAADVRLHRGPAFGMDKPSGMDKAREYIRVVKDFPNLLCYYIDDEANIESKEPPEGMAKIHQIVKEEDPYHPTYFNGFETSWIGNYQKACDINGFDYYPLYTRGGECTAPLSRYAYLVKDAINQVNNSQPIWVVTAAHEGGRINDPWHRRDRIPNYRENRCVAYISIINGAKGIWWWTYEWTFNKIVEHPEWYGIKAVTRELSILAPVFLSKSSSREARTMPADKDLFFLLKEYQDEFYLLSANSSREDREATFSLPWLTGKELRVLGEGREVPLANGTFKDSFAKYGVHIYTTSKTFSEIASPIQMEAGEKRLLKEEADRNQSNIFTRCFFEEKGISYKESSRLVMNTDWFNPSWATDGLKHTYWIDGTPDEFPDWLEVDLESPRKIGKIVIYTPNQGPTPVGLNSYELQYWKDGNWVAIARVEGNCESRIVHTFQPLEISRLRVFCTKSNGKFVWCKGRHSIIQEIEAY